MKLPEHCISLLVLFTAGTASAAKMESMLLLLQSLQNTRTPTRTWMTSSIAKVSEDLGYIYADSPFHLLSSDSGGRYFTSGIAEAKDYAVSISTEATVCGSSFCDLRIICLRQNHSADLVKRLSQDPALKKYKCRDETDIRLDSLKELQEFLYTLTEIAKPKPIVSAWTKQGQVTELKQKLQVK